MALIHDSFSGTAQEGRGLVLQADYAGFTDEKPRFVGWAPPGKLTSDPVWKISRMTYDGNRQLIAREWADGDTKFDNVWDDRAILVYS